MANPADPLFPRRTPPGPAAPAYTAAFYRWIGYPPGPHENTRAAADAYYRQILAVLSDATTYPLTHSERGRLQRIEKRWKKRAAGADARWAVHGSRAGRLPVEEERALRPLPHPAWRD